MEDRSVDAGSVGRVAVVKSELVLTHCIWSQNNGEVLSVENILPLGYDKSPRIQKLGRGG
jgi:hypothetical protein